MLGKNPAPPPPAPVAVNNGKGSNPIKVVKRDAHAVRIVRTYLFSSPLYFDINLILAILFVFL